MSTDTRTAPVILPIIPSKPRLRFMTDPAPVGVVPPVVTPPVVTPPVVTPPVDTKPPWGDDPTKFDPDKAWALIQNLRTDAEKRQEKTDAAIAAAAEKAQKDTLAQFAKLLAGAEEPETDPVKLAAKVTDLSSQIAEKDTNLTQAQAQVKAANLETAIAILAPTLGANTKLLLSNAEFKTSIASAEPTDEAALTAAITKALQVNAALKQPPAASGAGDHTGPTVQSLEAALAQAIKDGDVGASITLKRRIAAATAKS